MHLPDLKVVPWWIILSAHAAIGLGTLTGGWRIVRTMGSRITKLQAVLGLLRRDRRGGDRHRGVGVGHPGLDDAHDHRRDHRRRRDPAVLAVRWGVAGRIVYAWVLTIPMAAAIGALSYGILHAINR